MPRIESQPAPPLPYLHLEFWVSPLKDRAKLRRVTKGAYRLARRITRTGGGSGPWVFIVDRDPDDAKSARLRKVLGVRTDEDLWAELAFYPDREAMRKIIGRIWRNKQFRTHADSIGKLVSKRKPGFEGIVSYAALEAI